MMQRIYSYLLWLLLFVLLVGCIISNEGLPSGALPTLTAVPVRATPTLVEVTVGETAVVATAVPATATALPTMTLMPTDAPLRTPEIIGTVDEVVLAQATDIMVALKEQDMETLATFVHPKQGIRFSPYGRIRVDNDNEGEDLSFTAEMVGQLLVDDTVYQWGRFDGGGDPIAMTFADYYARFVYEHDFLQPDVIGYDTFVGYSNTLNNMREVYEGAVVIEYHFTGFDPQYDGIDWRSLYLILVQEDARWYLVGIAHGEWTI